MSRDYQRIKKNKYRLPHDAYHATLWAIRGYERMKAEAEAILEESPPPPDGQPRGTGKGDEVASKAQRREEYLRKISAIDEAFEIVPPEYRRGVWRSIVYFDPFPVDADRSTYGRWKSRFVYEAATRLGII